LASAEAIADDQKNKDFGFKCLHYSVSEASESLHVHVINKSGEACSIRVKTMDGEATAGNDYAAFDDVINFSKGET